ncbi:hypothetical protein ACOJBO_07735 [Rhizobium beringeri]
MPLADLDRISKVDGIKVISKGYEDLTYQLVVEINHRRKELADLRVRQAIAQAIDKKIRGRHHLPRLRRRLDRSGAEECAGVLYIRCRGLHVRPCGRQ